MGFAWFARRWTLVTASIVAIGSAAPPVRAQESARAGSATKGPASGADKEGRSLFAQGQIHYSLGEYPQAVAHFRRAYELTAAPGLLFNIAQAHRLAGDCKLALEVYRHFVRLAPESQY